MVSEDPLLTTRDASRILQVTQHSVRYFARIGKLIPDEETPSGQRLYRRSTIEKLHRERLANPPRPGRPRKDKESGTGQ